MIRYRTISNQSFVYTYKLVSTANLTPYYFIRFTIQCVYKNYQSTYQSFENILDHSFKIVPFIIFFF